MVHNSTAHEMRESTASIPLAYLDQVEPHLTSICRQGDARALRRIALD